MLTRGRLTNNAYLVTVGDGDPHSLIHPDTINPATATDQLERILAHDESPISATTTLRQAGEPGRNLGPATDQYRDAIVFASAYITSEIERLSLERSIDRLLPGITRAPAWPALFSQLLTIRADNRDPIAALVRVAADPVTAGRDPAATLAGRLDDTTHYRAAHGPLQWLNPVPANLLSDPQWGAYLSARAERVGVLARQLHDAALAISATPGWVADGIRPPSALVAEIEVWRAANSVPDTDRRPTGEHHHIGGPGRHQERLDQRLTRLSAPALDEWADLLRQLEPNILRDDYASTLATRVARLASAGIDAPALLRHAMSDGALPDDHAAAALWWRISAHLTPAVAKTADTDHHLAARWLPDLEAAVGVETFGGLSGSTWWPALVTAIELGLQRGWTLNNLIGEAPASHSGLADTCQAWVWRLTLATGPLPTDQSMLVQPEEEAPEDLHIGWEPADHVTDMPDPAEQASDRTTAVEPADNEHEPDDPDREADRILAFEALVRQSMRAPEPTAAEFRRQQDRADTWHECPYTPERLALINELATQFDESRLPGSWAQPYLTDRLRQSITGHPGIRPGYAPDGWTTLVDNLHRQGVSDHEMLTAGVATTASTGRLIDRFRDRVVFPITHNGEELGFVGRRNPALADDGRNGPNYLNTGETPLFHKGDQLYIAGETEQARAVLVEGPMDAIAVALATGGTHYGAAPLGTSLTDTQARQLAELGAEPIIATDADPAGRTAAERDYWMLAPLLTSPLQAVLPESTDPADLLSAGRGGVLVGAITEARPLAEGLAGSCLSRGTEVTGLLSSTHVLAASAPSQWAAGIEEIAQRTGMPAAIVRTGLASAIVAWNKDPRRAATAWRTENQERRPYAIERSDITTSTQARAEEFRERPAAQTEVKPAVGL